MYSIFSGNDTWKIVIEYQYPKLKTTIDEEKESFLHLLYAIYFNLLNHENHFLKNRKIPNLTSAYSNIYDAVYALEIYWK